MKGKEEGRKDEMEIRCRRDREKETNKKEKKHVHDDDVR